ncbi:MAG: hypothetical protein C0598_11440 [Marinilabiliales bacterium]|nr:MAG: hypothetical protein C0598_11440 [Marinilabiliales bacterium]
MENLNLVALNKSSFFNEENNITYIGEGEIGGKASGLLKVKQILQEFRNENNFDTFDIAVPALCVIRTKIFEQFMKRNDLYKIGLSKLPDDRKAHAFQKADLPFEILGDLRKLISELKTPIAIRSSSMLEDAKNEPFAGIYETKMTPNNQADVSTRFNKLVEAIKFVYASTFFKNARDYMRATKYKTEDERMAIIIQEVAGKKRNSLFYPQVSGVIRSFNFYSFGNSKPEDGIVNLALGLGKTIVENEPTWFFSPAFPRTDPPFYSLSEMMKNTQNKFWAVNMSGNYKYDPTKETEFLVKEGLDTAEKYGTLRQLASTLDSSSGRLVMGIGKQGPRLLNFAPILRLGEIPLPELCEKLGKKCQQKLENPVEIEFTMELDELTNKHKFGFLQLRPMNMYDEEVDVEHEHLTADNLLCSSPTVLGNGDINDINDIIFLKKNKLDAKTSSKIADEIDKLNTKFAEEEKKYILIGFGRWGTSDPWAGIPITFGQISNAKAIIEAPLEGMNSELSQGSHFFHNLSAFKTIYFSIPYSGNYPMDWDWLESHEPYFESENIVHLKFEKNIRIKVDGHKGLGLIEKPI